MQVQRTPPLVRQRVTDPELCTARGMRHILPTTTAFALLKTMPEASIGACIVEWRDNMRLLQNDDSHWRGRVTGSEPITGKVRLIVTADDARGIYARGRADHSALNFTVAAPFLQPKPVYASLDVQTLAISPSDAQKL